MALNRSILNDCQTEGKRARMRCSSIELLCPQMTTNYLNFFLAKICVFFLLTSGCIVLRVGSIVHRPHDTLSSLATFFPSLPPSLEVNCQNLLFLLCFERIKSETIKKTKIENWIQNCSLILGVRMRRELIYYSLHFASHFILGCFCSFLFIWLHICYCKMLDQWSRYMQGFYFLFWKIYSSAV